MKVLYHFYNLPDKWISSPSGTHPLQKLWSRKDYMATNELYFFGLNLTKLKEQNPKWVNEQVRHIKEGMHNNRLGAFFEINALGILSTDDQLIKPAKANNPGIDGVLTLPTGKHMQLSLKNYGDSSHYQKIITNGKWIEKHLASILKEKGIVSIQIVIDAVKRYPEKEDWDNLLEQLPNILDQYDPNEPKVMTISDFWLLMIFNIHDDFQSFHQDHNSYTLLLTSVYHKNEKNNLFSKLEEACANLNKHHKNEDPNTINVVMIHIPELGSITACKQWATEYFDQYPDKPISGVLLYQPTIANNLTSGNKFINNCFQFAVRQDRFDTWNAERYNINFLVPVGRISEEPVINKLAFIINGEKKYEDLSDRYWFQSGHHYLKQVVQPDGSIVGNIKNLASGVFAHAILEPFPGQAAILLEGHFPPEDKLTIL
ncbi:hypothetical protein GCM10028810_59420 [Spirosoma litoris]